MIAQRKNSYYQRQKDARIQQVMDTLVIDTIDDVTFARVPSTSKVGQMYIVTINESGKIPYAEKCTCPGNYEHSKVCVHCIGVNRFYQRIHTLLHPVVEVTIPVSEVMADADTAVRINEQQAARDAATDNLYDVLGTTKKPVHGYGCCGHIVKVEHDGQPCGACLCK